MMSGANYQRTLEEMKEKFGKSITPFVYPIREGDEFKGFVEILLILTARRYEGKDRVGHPCARRDGGDGCAAAGYDYGGRGGNGRRLDEQIF